MLGRCLVAITLVLFMTVGSAAEAAKWSRQYIRQLPDSAFAAIETTPDGKTLRHLPHHDAAGNLDLPHLRSALSRLDQVKWQDPAHAEAARRHLLEHRRQHRQERRNPPPKAAR
ncbi:MAG TPA: hypothetical protein VLT62_13215 [Candidatus Methylomirabilis sp.]|nr:hypothetical protein [Candidatus Methylomirabilis sp.]